MIWSVDVKFEAVDHEAALSVRLDIENALADELDRAFSVGGLAEVAPLVVFDEDI